MHVLDHYYPTRKPCCGGWGSMKVASAMLASGARVHVAYCDTCGSRVHGWFVSASIADSVGVSRDIGSISDVARYCQRCFDPGAEFHHMAPRHLFGDEAELWPQFALCRPCHAEWHTIMTPEMRSRPRPVADLPAPTVTQIVEARRSASAGRYPWGVRWCAFCGTSKGVGEHSWAPTGGDAAQWPSSSLCPRCKARWCAHFPGHVVPTVPPGAVPF